MYGYNYMKDKYWAKNKYSTINPADYENIRFGTNAGKIIDEAEKESVYKLLKKYIPKTNKGTYRILDVATGPGRLAFYLEKHLPAADITGVDINDNMLEKARRFAQENKSKVKFVTGDIYKLPFTDNQFDAVVGLRFSMHIPPIDKVIREFSRILKKDGVLIFDIFNCHSILRLKLMTGNINKENCGFYSIGEITRIARSYKLELLGYKGILLFGETLIRKFPEKLLFLLFPIVNPSPILTGISTKLVLSFKKI